MNEIPILIVEDESIVAMELEGYITKLGYRVVAICSSGEDTITTLQHTPTDIVLMDIYIKGSYDGIETAEIIKKHYPNIEIIYLTAHLDDYNVDRAIQTDPSAYLSKPFNREELRVSLKIAVRKITQDTHTIQGQSTSMVLDHEFSYDMATATLYCCHERIHLTQKEHTLLELFIANTNQVLDYYTIENVIWSDKESNANMVRTLVKRLRQKLKHKFIVTVPLSGYRFELDKYSS